MSIENEIEVVSVDSVDVELENKIDAIPKIEVDSLSENVADGTKNTIAWRKPKRFSWKKLLPAKRSQKPIGISYNSK